MYSIKKVALALILIFSAHLAYSQTYTPAFKVSKGQEYNYKMDLTANSTQSMGGQEMKFGTTATSTLKNAIANVLADGKIEIITSSWDAKVSTKVMKDTTMTFPGKVGSSSKITVNKFGNVVSKVKMDTVATDAQLGGLDNGLISTVVFVEFPETPIKVGDKWTKEHNDSISAGPLGKLELKNKSEFTLGAKETIEGKSLYKVTCASSLQISGKGKMQGMDIAVAGTGVKTDDIYFDPSTGIVFSDKINMELDMNIAISGQQSMTIPMTQKITATLILIK